MKMFSKYWNSNFPVVLIIIMIIAIISTKIPVLLNEGFWQMAHAARTDWSMLLGSTFLLIVGTCKFSLDNYFLRKRGLVD